MGESALWSLLAATFIASFVEGVEALTIVLAMGLSRGWRSALAGVATAVAMLVVFTAIVGYALQSWLRPDVLHLVIGVLLLVFGLQWLRKAILRSAGLKELHDEDAEFVEQTEAARRAGEQRRFGLDWFAFVVSCKGVFLEGVEVVFIVITFGLSAGDVPAAASAAGIAGLSVLCLGVFANKPLSRVPENTLKYAVGLLLATFGTYWSVEGLGIWRGGETLAWPGGVGATFVLLAAWFVVSRALVALLPRIARPRRSVARPIMIREEA
ncbi:MAG: COG4280 domain-containing protein [Pseudonocardiaceae bacterium]